MEVLVFCETGFSPFARSATVLGWHIGGGESGLVRRWVSDADFVFLIMIHFLLIYLINIINYIFYLSIPTNYTGQA